MLFTNFKEETNKPSPAGGGQEVRQHEAGGKIALVTGASQGLGKAIALKLAANGADVAVIYVGPEEPALETCKEIEALGRRAVSYPCDVRDEKAVEETVAAVKKDLGKVDILVNNAGVTRDGLMVTMKDADYDMVLDINLKGAFHMIRACYRDFMRKKSGKIINISSIAGLVGNVGQVNYAASKAGLIGMSKSVAKELGSRGVCCNCIAPGFIETAMTKDIKEDNPLLVQVPMRKMGTPRTWPTWRCSWPPPSLTTSPAKPFAWTEAWQYEKSCHHGHGLCYPHRQRRAHLLGEFVYVYLLASAPSPL